MIRILESTSIERVIRFTKILSATAEASRCEQDEWEIARLERVAAERPHLADTCQRWIKAIRGSR